MKKKRAKVLPNLVYERVCKNPYLKKYIHTVEEADDPLVYAKSSDINVVAVMGRNDDLFFDEKINLMTAAHALAGWLPTKQIYSFNPDFWELLTAKGYDQVVPTEILYKVPYKVMFLEPLDAFVCFDRGMKEGELDFRVIAVEKDGSIKNIATFVVREGQTLDECIDATIDETRVSLNEKFGGEFNQLSMDRELLSKALQGVLYICASNADVGTSEGKKHSTNNLSKPIARVSRWIVGDVIIKTLGAEKNSGSSERVGVNQDRVAITVRPHVRRAHWHHYWKGSGASRELILKWVPPVYVNKNLGEIVPSVTKIK